MDVSDKCVRAWKTAREMIRDRGGDLGRAAGIGDEEVRRLAQEFATFGVRTSDRTSVVFHVSTTTIKKPDLFNAAEDAEHIIAIFRVKPQGTTTRSLLAEAATRGVSVEFFELTAMQYNVSRHMYVPAHARVPEEEVPVLLKSYYLKTRFQMPLILETDPMARYLALKHGDVVRITRPSPTSGETVFFRCCKSA